MKFTNLAKTELASQLLIAGTTFNVVTGKGAKFPTIGATNLFMGIIWGSAFNTPFDDEYYEIVLCYRSATDQITIVRSQEGTAAKQWEIGDNFMLTSTAGTFGRYETHDLAEKTTPVDADEFRIWDSIASLFKKLSFLNLKYAIGSYLNPVGTIREFNVSTNPATLLGFGTWSAYGTGRVTVAIDAALTEFDTGGETGGEKTHLLTGAESGTSVHGHPQLVCNGTEGSGSYYGRSALLNTSIGNSGFNVGNSLAANASSAHNNLQPYIVVYRWVRTA